MKSSRIKANPPQLKKVVVAGKVAATPNFLSPDLHQKLGEMTRVFVVVVRSLKSVADDRCLPFEWLKANDK